MKTVTRERFIDQFAISIQVHCLPLWGKRSKEPPLHVSRSIYETIRMCAGEISLASSAEFGEIVHPVIGELHGITPKGMRPDTHDLTGRVYDALDQAGAEVTIRPPVHPGPTPEGRGYRSR
jgi:hypothetical protein